ncbi:MAG: oligosaccharide flippase family protein [Candidatus Daviesbacteria bacterium]|nr:oligosaccharide flippase family protein [Candidatus Daviesbacteria bacterium]
MLKVILSTATFKQSQITVIGTIINGCLGALFYIVLARFLGPYSFGLLTVSVASLTLIADIVDFGTNTGIVRFVSSSLASNRDAALKFLKLSLEIKIVVWILVLAGGIILAPFIADKIFNKTELVMPLRLVMVGVGGALLFSFATSSLQAFQKYLTWSFVNIFTNFLRLLFILLLIFYQQLNLTSGLLVYLLLPFFGFSLTLFFIPARKIFQVRGEFGVAKQFFKFNFWVAAFTLVAAISSRLDTFLIARLLSPKELGIYGAANQLVQVVPQIVSALGIVAAPKFASFVSIAQMIQFFKKFQLLVLGLAVLGSLVILISYLIIPFIYGGQYKEAVLPFIILFLAMLVFLISVPVHNSIIYYFGKPQVFVWVSIGHLLIIGFLGYLLVSNYGVVGAAVSVLAGMIFNFLIPLGWFLMKVRR